MSKYLAKVMLVCKGYAGVRWFCSLGIRAVYVCLFIVFR